MADKYLAIVVLVGVAITGYLALRRLIRPADLDASLTDEEEEAELAQMRASVENRRGGCD